ncbi:mediator of RNA polymerase II transcription subunit 22-like protein [Sarcoptes scabiei]|uniref:Mediator of RNA polymerase II transcription subunit 22 n=2 Tax=Sarcoptes scabiei TaxID=52283 RepID=A0A132A4L8_SARSC|nr:mediator of RNA polymerase II transcription subunit 22-like protein [Sarcoptes scabiei]
MATRETYESFLLNYQHRLRSDINTIAENFAEFFRTVRIDDKMSYSKLDELSFEVNIRAVNFVRACESLLKLIWEIKQYQTINDFPLINESITKKSEANLRKANEIDNVLIALRDEMTNELYDLEDEYYNSYIKYNIYIQ